MATCAVFTFLSPLLYFSPLAQRLSFFFMLEQYAKFN